MYGEPYRREEPPPPEPEKKVASSPTEEGEKDPLSSFLDGITNFIEDGVKNTRETINRLLGREEEEGAEPIGLEKIIGDVRQRIRETLGIEGEEKKLDLSEMIRNGRNRIRDLLGMEPLPED